MARQTAPFFALQGTGEQKASKMLLAGGYDRRVDFVPVTDTIRGVIIIVSKEITSGIEVIYRSKHRPMHPD